jgi:chromosome segregation ATPase
LKFCYSHQSLPELQGQRQSLQNEILDKQRQKQELQRALQVINKRITELADVEKMHQRNFHTLADKVCNLQNQKHQLEQFASKFKNSNKTYVQIKSIAEQVVDRLLKEQEPFLDLALKAVIEALRMNPDRYAIIYNSKYDNNKSVFDSSTTISSSSPLPPLHSPILENQNYYFNEYHEGLVEIAKGFLNILLNQLVDKTMRSEWSRRQSNQITAKYYTV